MCDTNKTNECQETSCSYNVSSLLNPCPHCLGCPHVERQSKSRLCTEGYGWIARNKGQT